MDHGSEKIHDDAARLALRRRALGIWAQALVGTAAILATLVLTGCYKGDDPYAGIATSACLPGNVRGAGRACAVPRAAILIDGDAADWAVIDPTPLSPTCLAPPCDALLAESAQFALITDPTGDRLAVRVRLAGGAAPRTDDPTVRYLLELSGTPSYRTPGSDAFLAGGGEVRFTKNGFFADPPAGTAPVWQLAWLPDGFEASVPTAYLPYPFGARVAVYAVRQDGEAFRAVSSREPTARACWIETFVRGDRLDDFRGDPCGEVAP